MNRFILSSAAFMLLPQLASADDTSDQIAKQLGQLIIANAQCAAQVQSLAADYKKLQELEKKAEESARQLKEKCGAPCKDIALVGDTPGQTSSPPVLTPPKASEPKP